MFLFRKLWYTTSIQTQSIYINMPTGWILYVSYRFACCRTVTWQASIKRNHLGRWASGIKQLLVAHILYCNMWIYVRYVHIVCFDLATMGMGRGANTLRHNDSQWSMTNFRWDGGARNVPFILNPPCLWRTKCGLKFAPGKWTGKLLYKFQAKVSTFDFVKLTASGSWKLWPSSGGDPQVPSDEPGWDSWTCGPTVCIKLHDMGHWDRWKFLENFCKFQVLGV